MDVEPAANLPGDPDGMERLWTPHRLVYLGGQGKPEGSGPQECPFCRSAAGDDATGLVVARGTVAFVVLNLYPYNSGHLMVLPYRHVGDLTVLDEAETAEISALTRKAITALRTVYAPHGFNLGINQGSAAGAGIAAHLHQHVVPRWEGDSNFMPIIARTKTLPELLASSRERLAAAWPVEPQEESC